MLMLARNCLVDKTKRKEVLLKGIGPKRNQSGVR